METETDPAVSCGPTSVTAGRPADDTAGAAMLGQPGDPPHPVRDRPARAPGADGDAQPATAGTIQVATRSAIESGSNRAGSSLHETATTRSRSGTTSMS